MALPLITKYRPASFDEVIGHEDVLAALQRAMASDSRPHAYLLTGPSGLGKTTLARIIASAFEAEVTEIDAASNNGVDDMRELVELGNHSGFGASGVRMFIIDECHMLTRNAWNAILKLLEDPPEHLFIALCTTELSKVLETVQTRCYHVQLRPLRAPDMEALLSFVAECEEWQVNNDVMQAVVAASTGQPRKGLSILQAVHDATSRDEVRRIVSLMDASDPIIALLQHIVSGKNSWRQVQGFLQKMDETDFDELMISAGRYIATVLIKTDNAEQAQRLWQMLEALVFPASSFDKKVLFIAALGRMLWGG